MNENKEQRNYGDYEMKSSWRIGCYKAKGLETYLIYLPDELDQRG